MIMPEDLLNKVREQFPELAVEDAFVAPRWYFQQDSWLQDPDNSGSVAYNYPLALRMRGPLELSALERSLQELVRRHSVLRSVFRIMDGRFVQLILRQQTTSLQVVELADSNQTRQEQAARHAALPEVLRPFDLLRGPLLRALLLKLADQDHVLLLNTHHIVCDDWSAGILLRELSLLYSAFTCGKAPPLSPVSFQYGDFVRRLEKQLRGPELQNRIDFWRDRLGGGGDFHHVQPDRLRPRARTYQGANEKLVLSEELVTSLKQLSQRQCVSLFMTALAAFQCVLHRYAREDDIAVGCCVANRPLSEGEGVVGPFANVVVLRTNFSGNPTFRELLSRVRETSLTAYAYQDLPCGRLTEILEPNPDASRNPLFQALFVYQNAPKDEAEFAGLSVSRFPIDMGTTRYELNLWLTIEKELEVDLQYNRDLFAPGTIRRAVAEYKTVLESMIHDPEGRVGDGDTLRYAWSLATPPAALPQEPPTTAPVEQQAASRSPQGSASPCLRANCGHRQELQQANHPVESTLLAIWAKVLGVRRVDVRDDFFELGGDSLLAVRLFTEIEKIYALRLPLATLFEARTVEALARVVREPKPPAGSSVVALQPKGGRPPFFCIHGGGGNVVLYSDLARHLGDDQPFYGLQSQGLNGDRPLLTRIEDMAALYINEMRTVQPRGPYFLGGYCMGGTVALEMAQQLRAQGEQVALLAFFDTCNWSNIRPQSLVDHLYFHLQKVVFHWRNFSLLNWGDKRKFLGEKFQTLNSRSIVWLGMLLGRMMGDRSNNQSVLLARLWRINEDAALGYIPRGYAGRITDFRPLRQYARYLAPGPTWQDLTADGVDCFVLPVYPAGMLGEPFVRDLAARLRKCIDRALDARPLVTAEADLATSVPGS